MDKITLDKIMVPLGAQYSSLLHVLFIQVHVQLYQCLMCVGTDMYSTCKLNLTSMKVFVRAAGLS